MIQQFYFMDPPNPQYSMMSIASPATQNVTLLFMKSLYTTAGQHGGYAALGLTTKKITDYIKKDVTGTYEGFAAQSREYGEGIGNIRNTVDDIGKAMESLGDSVNGIAREIAAVTAASEENSNGVNDIMQKSEETGRITGDI